MRTVNRLTFTARPISRLLIPWANSSRIVVRWLWLNMVFLPGLGFLGRLWDSGCQTTQFGEDMIELVAHQCALFPIHQFQFCAGSQEPSVGPTDNRRHDLQITQQFLHRTGRRWRFDLPLGFEKQLRLFQNP